MDSQYRYRCGEAGSAERMVPAIVLIAIGAIFLLDNLHLFYFREIFQYWPVLLIAFGIVKLVDSASTGSRVAGGILAGAGGLLLARNLGYLDLRVRDMWPIVLIGIGVWMLFQRTQAEEDIPGRKGNYSGNRLKQQAVFSGFKQNIVTPDFEGGKVEVVFGGAELDFRRAGMAAGAATLHVDAVFGGVEIRVPPHWNIELRGNGVFGAFSDETLHPDLNAPEVKQLILKGGAVFGGVVVKN